MARICSNEMSNRAVERAQQAQQAVLFSCMAMRLQTFCWGPVELLPLGALVQNHLPEQPLCVCARSPIATPLARHSFCKLRTSPSGNTYVSRFQLLLIPVALT